MTKKFLTLPSKVLESLEESEMYLLFGGSSEDDTVVNDGIGVCDAVNNGTGICSVVNNSIGRCTTSNNKGGKCAATNNSRGYCKRIEDNLTNISINCA